MESHSLECGRYTSKLVQGHLNREILMLCNTYLQMLQVELAYQ